MDLMRLISSVIKRLINLLSDCARQMADSVAARKQAEGAQRHAEGLLNKDSKVRSARKSKRRNDCLVLEIGFKGR